MFKLVIQDDEGKTTVVPLIRDEITIGRKEGNTIRLTERNVSRRHARILRNNGEVHIEDLGSYNGIRVNNSRIAERVSLRVSDQVQIGDYKLYLKAEGVEQVDDARTMPIERVDTNGAPTEVMAAVPPATAPSGSVPPPLASTAPASPSQLIGNPNRTLVAIADTDPQGRPVATAATVAALSAPVGYGKLVVVSSNFAGKEYELSRPQMIIGRTDENDIVVNHRSISRNHAKLVREPDTGRYTISDLQSSNGVRVNGQDYGKVELRRGDVVDLGHVRLRFVEPGEDFVFSRDAVITDVPDSGGKKGLIVAVVLGVVVVGAVAAFMLFKNNPDESKVVKPGSDHTDLGSQTNGTDVAIVNGSNGSAGTVVNDTPADAPDQTPTVPSDAEGKKITARCIELQGKKQWGPLQDCANELVAHDPEHAKALLAKVQIENPASFAFTHLKELTGKNPNLKDAANELRKIPPESVYYAEAKQAYDRADALATEGARKRLATAAEGHNCKNFENLVEQFKAQGISNPAGDLHCENVAVIDHPPDHPKNPDHPKDPAGGSNVVVAPTPPCNAPQLHDLGNAEYKANNFASATTYFKKAYECGHESNVLGRAIQSACKAGKEADARNMFHMLPVIVQNGDTGTSLAQVCFASGIDLKK